MESTKKRKLPDNPGKDNAKQTIEQLSSLLEKINNLKDQSELIKLLNEFQRVISKDDTNNQYKKEKIISTPTKKWMHPRTHNRQHYYHEKYFKFYVILSILNQLSKSDTQLDIINKRIIEIDIRNILAKDIISD